MTNKELDLYWEFLIEKEIATERELLLVTSLNGYNEETLNDVLYVFTGYRTKEQYVESN